MTLTAFCDSCGKKIRVGQEYAGKKVKCLHCGHLLILPSRESFLSDPHAEFSQRSEEKERHDPGHKPALDVRDIVDTSPTPPPPVASPPVDALHGEHAHTDDVHVHPSDLWRGLQFGFGFWLAATPFLFIIAAFVLMLQRMF